MSFLEIESNLSDISKNYFKLQQKTEDLSGLLKPVSETMLHMIEDTFEEEGPGWPGLKASTKKARAKRGHWPGNILQDDRLLFNSLTPNYDKNSAWVWTNKIYAATHNFGADDRNIPQREFMKFTEEGLKAIDKDILNYFNKI